MESFFSERERARRTLLPVDVQIGAPTCGDGSEYISIEITDRRSGVQFVELRLSYADMMAALRGSHRSNVEAAVHGLDRVGMKVEHKTVTATVKLDSYSERSRTAYDAAQPLCVDGWRYAGPRPDNSQYESWRQGDWMPEEGGGYRVQLRFVRWVPYVETNNGTAAEPDRSGGAAPANPAIRHRRRKPDAP